ncbi:MAG: DNA polymerase III subunit beta [Candidatus Omnitrophica bacterium]|nr:DNA polymerase III subunit beta [Candidatus Omnitrophota bacterium]
MRLTIPQPQFLKNLQMVEHVVNERSTLPILANVLLETANNELLLTATDLDVGIQCRFPLSPPTEQGAVALPARKLTTIVRELPEDLVTLEAKKNHTATLNCGTSSFRIPGLPAEDFPVLPPTDGGEGVRIPQAALKALVAQTAYAMSMEETRFILNGALLAAQKNTLTMVATDGRRLAVATAAATSVGKQPLEAVIPSKTVRELGRLLQEETDELALVPLKDNQLTFRFGQTTIVTRLIEGQFPSYEKVIPPPSKNTMTCQRQQLTNAIRRASLMTTATSQAVVFELGRGRLIVSKESAELGSAREELEAEYAGEAMTVAFNPEFWLDVLKVLETEQVTIELSGPDRPAVIRQPSLTYLVLPMKVA